MSRRPPGALLRWLLATTILVAGSGSPVRYGHTHAHHGEHEHAGGADDHDHDHDHDPADWSVSEVPALSAWSSVAFHWHDSFALPFGPPAPNTDGTPSQVVGTSPWATGDVLPGTSALHELGRSSLPPMELPFDRHPPPSLRPVFRIPSGSAPPATSHLVLGAVPLRC